MARGFTPIIGLAVVVALALAAVFGAMSLSTNPAFAAPGQPADSQLTERTFSPQADATQTVHVGETVEVDITSVITGGGANYDGAGTIVVNPANRVTSVSVVLGFESVKVKMTGGSSTGTGRVIVPVELKDSETDQRIRIDVTVAQHTSVSATGTIPDQTVAEGGSIKLDVSDYFTMGKGAPGHIDISGYTASDPATIGGRDITITNPAAAVDSPGDDTYVKAKSEFTISALGANNDSTDDDADSGDSFYVTITATQFGDGPDDGTAADTATQSFFVDVGPSGSAAGDIPTVDPTGSDPGENTKYTVTFKAPKDFTTGVDEVTVEFTDFSVPASVSASAVTVSVTGLYSVTNEGQSCSPQAADTCEEATFTNSADEVAVDGEKLIIDLKVRSDDFVDKIKKDDTVKVVVSQSAGISNPTEAKSYGEVEVNGELAKAIPINLKLSLSEDEGGRNDTITVTGKGFKDGTTMTAYKMTNAGNDFTLAQGLCSAQVGSDDVGKCSFDVTSPLFKSGPNYINVKDGRNQSVMTSKTFTLEPSIAITPGQASIGDSVQVQMYDFKGSTAVQGVRIARQYLCSAGGGVKLMTACGDGYTKWSPGSSTSSLGEQSFNLVIPDDAPQGVQELMVETADESDSANIVITGPTITSTPTTVLANQRVSLTGSGFTSSSSIAGILFAGDAIPEGKINGGLPVTVDDGGNWSASVVLPMTNSTVSAGTHDLTVVDSAGRGGKIEVTVPERKVTITPNTGRVGTIAVVRGENFPSKNDDGQAFSISIEYSASNGKTTATTVPDASGRFEQQITIPTTANIPSTNSVTVSFTTAAGTKVPLLVSHNVPEGAISLSATSGAPGTSVTISGEGFKSYVPVDEVKVGSIEVTPAPKPSTDSQGMMSFDITIPGLDVGIQTIEVDVGDTTASVGFTVVESGVSAGDITPSAEAVENLGDNFVVAWHFNNDSKTWTFYDGMEGSDLASFITGESYLLQVAATTETILNGKTRNLTCVGGNCWNQIVW